ncbi:MAG TPA: hypothetical protein VG897_14300 [Terriglobales bacterium]|nr:hypothetical protein [Terriglobales bacterium]
MACAVQAEPGIWHRYEMVAGLPRPRPLRRTAIGNFTVILATVLVGLIEIALLVHLYFLIEAVSSLGELFAIHKMSVLAILVVPLFVPLVRSGLRQQRWMVSEGEVAIATVQARYPATRQWRVDFEFEDSKGRRISSTAMDSTGKHFLVEGQQMLVYYMSSNPYNALPQCMASYEPTVNGVEPDPRFN